MLGELASVRHEAPDTLEAIEYCYRAGWTDGLPVVPPTEARVRLFLEEAGLAPETIVAELPDLGRALFAEKVAINAVMAGCLPAYLPVVLAAVEAMAAPEFCLSGCLESTGSAAPLTIVNGPLRERLGFNAGADVFGPGHRPN